MKYQDYEFRTYERFEQNLKKIQTRLTSKRKTLTKARIPIFERIQKFEFVNYYSLAIECEREEGKAEKKMKSTEQKLKLTEKKLKIAESDDLKKRVERVI